MAWQGVAPRRILVAGASYLLSVEVGEVCIYEGAQQQAGILAGMSGVDMDVLAQPVGAAEAPSRLGCQVILVGGLPAAVVEVCCRPSLCDARVEFFEELVPALRSPHIGGCRLLAVLGIIVQACLGDHQGCEALHLVHG